MRHITENKRRKKHITFTRSRTNRFLIVSTRSHANPTHKESVMERARGGAAHLMCERSTKCLHVRSRTFVRQNLLFVRNCVITIKIDVYACLCVYVVLCRRARACERLVHCTLWRAVVICNVSRMGELITVYFFILTISCACARAYFVHTEQISSFSG